MQLDPVLLRHLPSHCQSTIADLGCGRGELVKELRAMGYRLVTGIDRRLQWGPEGRELGLICCDLREFLKFNDLSYRCIILWDTLEHLPKIDVLPVLRNIRHTLRPDGTLILHVPNAEGLFGARIMYSDLTHRWAYTPQLITTLLTRAGFMHVQCYECRPIVHGPVSFLRACAWACISVIGRLVLAVETGQWQGIMSQNMVVVAQGGGE